MPTRREFLTHAAGTVLAGAAVDASIAEPDRAAERKPVIKARDAQSTEPLKLVIVGVGDISPRYLRQAAANTRAKFVATCARTLASAQARAREYGIGAWYDNYLSMYDAVKPDGVVIATPNSLHLAPTIAALERGIAVLCEKPMATTWEECKAMVAAAEKSRAVSLFLPFDTTPPHAAALAHLTEAALGVFTGAESQMLFPPLSLKDWNYDRSVAGGWMLSAMVYPVGRLISLLGPAERVTAFANTLIPHRIMTGGKTAKSTIDDNVSLLIEWPGGQQGVMRALDGASYWRNDAAIYGRHGTLWLSGTDVVIHSPRKSVPGAEPITWNGQKDCYRVPVKPAANEGLIEHFVDCIEGISQPLCSAQQQLHVHEILFNGYEAAKSGKTQELETTFTPSHHIEPSFHDTRSRPI